MSDRLANPTSARELCPVTFRDFVSSEPFKLELGGELPSLTLRYETYGTLLPDKSNAILVPHALSGDHHVAGRYSAEDRKPGWWDCFVGPGKAIDTNRFFVIGVNCIGGCRGSTGPLSTDPRTGKPYGGYFPEITLGDIVRAQRLLVRHLGIAKLHAVVGGSMGGMQALIWCADYQAEVGRIAVLAAGLSQSPMAIALNAVSRACVERDPNFRGGHYTPGEGPDSGLAIGRMIAHISYLSSASFEQKFGRAKVPGAGAGDAVHWQVESYLEHQGKSFVQRFGGFRSGAASDEQSSGESRQAFLTRRIQIGSGAHQNGHGHQWQFPIRNHIGHGSGLQGHPVLAGGRRFVVQAWKLQGLRPRRDGRKSVRRQRHSQGEERQVPNQHRETILSG